MDISVTHDEVGTHFEWEHDGITPKMIDWFWSNMEKCFLLWHPEEHQPLTWAIAPKHGNLIGAVHLAPQTWSDGKFQNLHISFEDPASLPDRLKETLIYEHCIVAGGLGFGPESIEKWEVFGYRIHQWQKTDSGVVGKSSAIEITRESTPEAGLVWARHCSQEIGNFKHFLPQLYSLYKVVTNTDYNPFTDLTIEGKGEELRYKYIYRS
jgi:hypothetical protein